MAAPINTLKAALLAGETQKGLWLNMATAISAEIAGRAGFDWCLIDGEHGPNTLTSIQTQLMVLAGTGTPAVVRVPMGEDWLIKQVLDLGAQSVMVPMIESAEDARAAVAAVRYPPRGKRGIGAFIARAGGYGQTEDYIATADEQVCLIVQVESAKAIDNIDEIASVDGVDVVFIGPYDLSADMGLAGQLEHPDVVAAVKKALVAIKAAGKPAGIISFDPVKVAGYADEGIGFIGVGADSFVLAAALADLAC